MDILGALLFPLPSPPIRPAVFSSLPLHTHPWAPSLSASVHVASVHRGVLLHWNLSGTEGHFQLYHFKNLLKMMKMFFCIKGLKTNFDAEVQEKKFALYGCSI